MFFTEIEVPTPHAITSCFSNLDPEITKSVPNSSSFCLLFTSSCEIAAIEGNASPLNPIVVRENKSSEFLIFEVACLSKAILASVGDIPLPSSVT